MIRLIKHNGKLREKVLFHAVFLYAYQCKSLLAHPQQLTIIHNRFWLIRYNLRSYTTNSSSSATIYAHALQTISSATIYTHTLQTLAHTLQIKRIYNKF